TNGQHVCALAPPSFSLQDEISSCGFVTEFVIAPAESQPVLAACDALIECCGSLADSGARRACFDQVDQRELQASCASTLERYRDNGQCQPASASADAGASSVDAGDALSSRYALCCYQVCGHTNCI
ncbi:MAG TPA: hypothetical protein VNN80_04400, partial [Polyangiaceae bacterium]|nr:hypothetical protein [Polyangiaceae bacterium]